VENDNEILIPTGQHTPEIRRALRDMAAGLFSPDRGKAQRIDTLSKPMQPQVATSER
jgi:hypothetical protein